VFDPSLPSQEKGWYRLVQREPTVLRLTLGLCPAQQTGDAWTTHACRAAPGQSNRLPAAAAAARSVQHAPEQLTFLSARGADVCSDVLWRKALHRNHDFASLTNQTASKRCEGKFMMFENVIWGTLATLVWVFQLTLQPLFGPRSSFTMGKEPSGRLPEQGPLRW
jgi:hypothetical protein